MAYFSEKPPILTGDDRKDIASLRDWLFRLHESLQDVAAAETSTSTGVTISTRSDGQQVLRTQGGGPQDIEAVKQNARELKSLIIKSAKNLQKQIDNIEYSTFYIKYADDFAGNYPATMYNSPKASTYYMGVCSSTEATAPTNPAAYSWSRIKGDGGTGLNSATVFLYRRAENPPAKPQADLEYTFASGRLDMGPVNVSAHTLHNVSASVSGHRASSSGAEVEGHLASVTGWTQEIPDSDGRPCWVITATAIATTATDIISASEWSEVKKLVEDGSPGQEGAAGRDGTNGSNGRDGTDGYNSCVIYLYRRSESTAAVDFTEALTYSFAAKRLLTTPEGWYRTPPAGDAPLYVTAATAMSRTDTDSVAASEWSSPVILVENGNQGIEGPPGADGQTTYLHIKYSDDGETFTGNDGEDVGAWIGTLTDYNATDSMIFSDYTWHRFADDEELQAAIQETGLAAQEYCDRKVESLSSLYVAQSEYGTFKEEINTTIETTAKNTVESYGYGASIEALDRRTDLMQKYLTAIDGEIRRGIVEDPNTGDYVTGIAISQNLKFSGECGSDDPNNPNDGYIYYYIDEHQTFGLYTSTGWQFWIDGYRRGWFSSIDNMLHVANIVVENVLQIGDSWQLRTALDGAEFEILYVGA